MLRPEWKFWIFCAFSWLITGKDKGVCVCVVSTETCLYQLHTWMKRAGSASAALLPQTQPQPQLQLSGTANINNECRKNKNPVTKSTVATSIITSQCQLAGRHVAAHHITHTHCWTRLKHNFQHARAQVARKTKLTEVVSFFCCGLPIRKLCRNFWKFVKFLWQMEKIFKGFLTD